MFVEMTVIWDQRSHGTESLVSNDLKEFQGPALCIANNAVFSEKVHPAVLGLNGLFIVQQDFENIKHVENSYKQHENDKIGKYGVGFNSVYHLTDLPSFVSTDKLVIFDPHARYLPAISDSPVTGMEVFIKLCPVMKVADFMCRCFSKRDNLRTSSRHIKCPHWDAIW